MSMIKAPLIFAGNSQNIIVPLLINKFAIRVKSCRIRSLIDDQRKTHFGLVNKYLFDHDSQTCQH